jgi:hypothetical protein
MRTERLVVASREALEVVGGRGAERVTGSWARAGGDAGTGGAGAAHYMQGQRPRDEEGALELEEARVHREHLVRERLVLDGRRTGARCMCRGSRSSCLRLRGIFKFLQSRSDEGLNVSQPGNCRRNRALRICSARSSTGCALGCRRPFAAANALSSLNKCRDLRHHDSLIRISHSSENSKCARRSTNKLGRDLNHTHHVCKQQARLPNYGTMCGALEYTSRY